MEKTGKCYYYFALLSTLLGILFVVVFWRLHSGFEHPSQDALHNFLSICQYPLLVGFILSISVTIALKCILDDLESTLASLKVDTDEVSKKIKELEKHK